MNKLAEEFTQRSVFGAPTNVSLAVYQGCQQDRGHQE